MPETVIEQILQVRNTGRTNMFDIGRVMEIAFELDLFDLVAYLDDGHTEEYANFIITGSVN